MRESVLICDQGHFYSHENEWTQIGRSRGGAAKTSPALVVIGSLL